MNLKLFSFVYVIYYDLSLYLLRGFLKFLSGSSETEGRHPLEPQLFFFQVSGTVLDTLHVFSYIFPQPREYDDYNIS